MKLLVLQRFLCCPRYQCALIGRWSPAQSTNVRSAPTTERATEATVPQFSTRSLSYSFQTLLQMASLPLLPTRTPPPAPPHKPTRRTRAQPISHGIHPPPMLAGHHHASRSTPSCTFVCSIEIEACSVCSLTSPKGEHCRVGCVAT